MNYKKPVFWIIVAAIICLVVVYFLTNPADIFLGARFNHTDFDVGVADNSTDTYGEVKVIETVSDVQESSYRVSVNLPATDLSAPGRVLAEKIEKEWNTFDSMTRTQLMVSSHLWGIVYLETDTWSECEQAIGVTIHNPLESIDWIDKTGYIGMESADPSTPVRHVKATAHSVSTTDRKPGNIRVEAGYRNDDIRITLTATVYASAGAFTIGSITHGYATYDQSTLTTGSGVTALVVTTNETNNTGYYNGDYFAPVAYWVKDNVFYSLRVFADAEDQTEIQNTLARLLAEI